MGTLLVAAVLSLGPGEEPVEKPAEAAPDVSGSWLIVYAEEKGRRIQKWEQVKATIKDGALTYDRDGKDYTINLKFGPGQTLKASVGKEDATASGVYIAAQDYVCLSLSGGAFAAGEKKGASSGDFILILRKQRDSK
jgi:hypothetical protein